MFPSLVKLALLAPLVFSAPCAWGQYTRHSPLLHKVDDMPNLVRLVQLPIKAAARDAFLQAAVRVVARSQHEAGCVDYRLYEDVSTRNTFFVAAEWTSAAAWAAHRRQPYMGAYLQQLPTWLAAPATTTSYNASGRTVTLLAPAGP